MCFLKNVILTSQIRQKLNYLNNSSFYKTDIRKTNFKNSILKAIDFEEADLSMSSFENGDLSETSFIKTNLEKVDFRTSRNYVLSPEKNLIKPAKFSLSEISGLLHDTKIQIEKDY